MEDQDLLTIKPGKSNPSVIDFKQSEYDQYKSAIEIAIMIVIAIILIILGVEALNIYEKSKNKSYIVRTIGFLLLVAGIRVFISLLYILVIPLHTRKNLRRLHYETF